MLYVIYYILLCFSKNCFYLVFEIKVYNMDFNILNSIIFEGHI